MDDKKGFAEVDFKEAVELKDQGHKFIWLGREPLEYIDNVLDLNPTNTEAVAPDEVMTADKFKALEFKGCVFACYHGNTSGVVVKALKQKFGVEAYSLKGGVTAVVGEIF